MSEAVETEARELGWRPQEEFRGDPDKWVDAATFLERGKTVLPLLRKDNERLHGTVEQLNGKVNELTQLLEDSQESIKALMEFHDQDAQRRVESAVRKVKAELAAAQESGDHAAVAELTDQLVDLKTAIKEHKEAPPAKPNGEAKPTDKKDYTQEPWFREWHGRNTWYGKDMVKTAVANMIAERLRLGGDRSQGAEFLDKVSGEVDAEMKGYGGQPSSRVEAGRGGGGGGGGGKAYADLPAEAKAVCERQASRLVGKGRAFETLKDWQTYYAQQFFKE